MAVASGLHLTQQEMMMFKSICNFTLTLLLAGLMQTQAIAWEQHALPTSFSQSSTAHYGGNKAPLVLSTTHIKTAAPSVSGMLIWQSRNDGIDWSSVPLSSNPMLTEAYLASASLALGWGETVEPTMFHFSASSNSWSAASFVWPLANANIIDVSTSIAGELIVLATTPVVGKLVEGELFVIYGNQQGWSTPIRISAPSSLVGDATIISHPTGLQSIVWSQRHNNVWDIWVSNSSDQQTWSSAITVVQNIAAPYFQESAVQLAADTLNHEEIALAFTGWSLQAHSQVWSKAFAAISGSTTQSMVLLPDAGDMVLQPSLVSLADDTWAVAWQQKTGIDSEIFVAQHEANGTWTEAINVSADAIHMDRDPHIAKGSSQTLNVAYTRRIQPDVQEVYMFTEGDIHDASLDSDADGIADSQEEGFDLDQDGIDDALSARVATWLTPNGRYALIVEGNGELRKVQAPSLIHTQIQTPNNYHVSGSLFSFQIHALNQGETTQVHLITPALLDEDTTWLKLNPYAQWSDSESNTVFHDETGKGLIIYLTDGGAGDEDGISNGIIVDPAALATPKTAATIATADTQANNNSANTAKGCLTPLNHSNSPWVYMLSLILFAGITVIKKKTNVVSSLSLNPPEFVGGKKP